MQLRGEERGGGEEGEEGRSKRNGNTFDKNPFNTDPSLQFR